MKQNPIILSLLLSLFFLLGCKTTPDQNISQSIAAAVRNTHEAEQTWASHVNSGQATDKETTAVGIAIQNYYQALKLARSTLQDSQDAHWGNNPQGKTLLANATLNLHNASSLVIKTIDSIIFGAPGKQWL